MLGAIIGDMSGSTREFARTKIASWDFPLFEKGSAMTDDSILTLAVMDGAVRGLGDAGASRLEIARSIKAYSRAFPGRGYGGRFAGWILSDSLDGYGSFGNGSAMRVSSIAYLYEDIDEVEAFARISALPTHDHAEGVRGAQAIAGAISLALHGADKAAIERYVTERHGYALPQSVEHLRREHAFSETCMISVPAAARCFLDADSFESCIRNAVWIGGDADTEAAIAGGIAEAMWGVPRDLAEDAYSTIEKYDEPGLADEVRARCTALAYIMRAHRGDLPGRA